MKSLNIRTVFKESALSLRDSLFESVLVSIASQSLALILISQVANRFFELALLSARVEGITNENIIRVLFNPITFSLIFITIVLAALFIVLQLTINMAFANRPYTNRKFSFKVLLKPFKRMKVSHFALLLAYVFLIMPNGNFGLSTSITSGIHLPNFIVKEIFENAWLSALYYSGLALCFYLNIRFFYSFIIFTSTEYTFVESLQESWKLTREPFFSILKLVVAFAIVSTLTLLGLLAIMQFPVWIAANYFPNLVRITNSISQTLYLFLMVLTYSFFSIFLVHIIVVTYHKLLGTEAFEVVETVKVKKRRLILNVTIFVAFVLAVSVVYFDDPSNPLAGEVLIIAHRGETRKAIENTLESLEMASEQGADYVEMDVLQTRDGELIVFHDYTLRRMFNRRDNVNDVDWSELKDLELQFRGHTSRIPSFDEYMSLARQLDQKILVEFKTTNRDSESFLVDIMDVVRKHDMEDMVLFQSLDKEAILEFKSLYNDATVGYVLGLKVGRLEKTNIDFYAIEDFSVRPRVLDDIRRQGKGVFVWTVNTKELMEVYLQLNVSGIITNFPQDAKAVQEELKYRVYSDRFWNFELGF